MAAGQGTAGNAEESVEHVDFVLYGTLGCHLCDEAERLLAHLLEAQPALGHWRIAVEDIGDDDALIERYGVRIPVLRAERSGAELGWPFDAATAAAWLRRHG